MNMFLMALPKILLLLFGLVLVWKLLPTLTREFFEWKNNSKKKAVDEFDNLVQVYKKGLKEQKEDKKEVVSPTDTATLQRLYEEKSKETSTEGDFAKKLLQALQWGDQNFFEPWVSELDKELNFSVSRRDLLAIVKFLMKKPWPQTLPSPSSLKEFVKISLFFEIGRTTEIQKLLPKLGVSDSVFRMALNYLLSSINKSYSVETLMEKVLDGKSEVNHLTLQDEVYKAQVFKLCLDRHQKGRDFFKSLYHDELKVVLVNLSRLTALSGPKQGDEKNWAMNLLGISSQGTIKDLKKRYHELIKSRHPDAFSTIKSLSLKKRIHDNFTLIQRAYDILENKKN